MGHNLTKMGHNLTKMGDNLTKNWPKFDTTFY